MAKECLVYRIKGYHIFCDWHKLKCEHNNTETRFVNHCKSCLQGMVELQKQPWANDDGKPIANIFNDDV